jgi:predicted dehydrogenase
MSEKVNIALLGYGYWGKIVEKYLHESVQFHLRTIYYPSAPAQGIFTNNLNDVVKDTAIQAVYIASPISTHFELCKKFLALGKAVFCEKPLTKSAKHSHELKTLAQASNAIIETNYIFCDSPTVHAIKSQMSHIGRLNAIELYMEQWGNFYANDDVFDVLGVHMLSLALTFIDGCVEDVYFTKTVTRSNGLCDAGHITLMIGGVPVFVKVSAVNINKRRTIVLYGEEGTIEANLMDEKKTLQIKLTNKVDTAVYAFEEMHNIARALQRFYDVVSGTRASNCSLAIAVDSVLGEKNRG